MYLAVAWGSVPEWVGALGTALAFGFIAAQVSMELGSRRRAQAARTSAWLVGHMGYDKWKVAFNNANELPLYEAFIVVGWTDESPTVTYYGTVEPHFSQQIEVVVPKTPVSSFPQVFVQFIDANGRAWKRTTHGQLKRRRWTRRKRTPTEPTLMTAAGGAYKPINEW